MRWNPRSKPSATVCPEEFCFHWAKRGDRVDASRGEYDTFEEAVSAAKEVVFSARCACVFGICSRASQSPENRDWYEPNERALKAAGLPWFYFIPGPEGVFREQYISESDALWGPKCDE